MPVGEMLWQKLVSEEMLPRTRLVHFKGQTLYVLDARPLMLILSATLIEEMQQHVPGNKRWVAALASAKKMMTNCNPNKSLAVEGFIKSRIGSNWLAVISKTERLKWNLLFFVVRLPYQKFTYLRESSSQALDQLETELGLDWQHIEAMVALRLAALEAIRERQEGGLKDVIAP